ncbi:MAG TPA: purine-nucleoside phosphorylase [Clostridia bacterium]|nr:purine-nucleoside phosphorylase [Clostridia bacterium]
MGGSTLTQLLRKITEAAAFVAQEITKAEIGIILGSGLGGLVEQVQDAKVIPYDEIPHFPIATVAGHAGRLVGGTIGGRHVVAMQGRFHYYEGYNLEEVTFPVRVMNRLGVNTLIITNAAGGLNPLFRPGDLMLISDHINFLGLNPLRGENMPELGPRFPDMTRAYDASLRQLAREKARSLAITLHEGVYVWVGGPSYETPAEVRMLQALGGDAVGMSTVPEVIVANHSGMRVLGFSCITNAAAGLGHAQLDHVEVVETAQEGGRKLQELVCEIISSL